MNVSLIVFQKTPDKVFGFLIPKNVMALLGVPNTSQKIAKYEYGSCVSAVSSLRFP